MNDTTKRLLRRYKLVHIVLWFVACLFVQIIYLDPSYSLWKQWLATMVVTGMAAIPTYYIAYRVIPRFLYSKRILRFLFLIVGIAFINAAITYFIAGYFYHLMSGKPMFPSVFYVVS